MLPACACCFGQGSATAMGRGGEVGRCRRLPLPLSPQQGFSCGHHLSCGREQALVPWGRCSCTRLSIRAGLTRLFIPRGLLL